MSDRDIERAGLLDRYDERTLPAPGLVLDPLPGHNPGHYGLYVGDPPGAVVVGHLFLHPAQIANPDVVQGDHDPELLRSTRRELLGRCERDQLLVIGPLFEAPGAGTVRSAGDGWLAPRPGLLIQPRGLTGSGGRAPTRRGCPR